MLNNRFFYRLYSPEDGGGSDTQTDTEQEVNEDDFSAFPEAAQREIRKLRAEAADRRKRLATFEAETRTREQKRLEEEGKFRELAQSRASEIEALSPYKERVVALEDRLKKQNDTRIAKIPDAMRKIVPTDYSVDRLSEWLDANEGVLTTRPAPDLNAGAGAGGQKTMTLTEDELLAAKKLGVKPEDYAKNKK